MVFPRSQKRFKFTIEKQIHMDNTRVIKAALITLAIIAAITLMILFAKMLLLALMALAVGTAIFFGTFVVVYEMIS